MNGQASKRLRLLKQLLSWSIAAFSGGLLYKALQKWTESRKRIQDDSSSHEIVVEHSYLRKDHFFSFFFRERDRKMVCLGSHMHNKKNHCLSTSCSDGEKGWQTLPYFAVKRDQDWEEKSSPQPREKKEEKKEPSDITQFGLPDDQFELSTKLDAGGQGTVFRCEA